MSSDKLREAFESWAITSAWMGLSGECLEFIDGGYVNCEVQAAWLGWQASRETLVIELPPARPEPISSGDELKSDGEAASWNIWVGDKLAKAECREAIEAAGLKVKS